MKMTRRRLIGGAAGLAASAIASSVLPANVRRALADEPRTGSLHEVKHVVMLMQENRSFDHYFGTLAGVRGFDDARALQLSSGRSVFHQPDYESPGGYLLPFHLDTRKTNAQKLPSTSHAWSVQHESWNGGKMDQWLPAHRKADGIKGPYVMGYHTRADIPFQFELAEAFTICDAYHCSVLGPTWPNRMYWMTGTNDPDGQHGGPIIKNVTPPGASAGLPTRSGLSKLGSAGRYIRSKITTNATCCKASRLSSELARAILYMTKECFGDHEASLNLTRLMIACPQCRGSSPPATESEHPDYMPADGAAFVASKIDAIAANPEVWAKTVFILNYDENDGIFDHAVPPTPPPGTPHEFVAGLPVGAGFRVPCILISPWTAGGWVCSQPFDHTSIVQFLEKFTGVREPNISDWRRATFGDLTAAFRFGDAKAQPPVLPDTSGPLSLALDEAAILPKPVVPGPGQPLPMQEAGKRKRIPRTKS